MDELFNEILDRILKHEGGYSTTPTDPGNWTTGKIGHGELKGTKKGIAASSYPHLDIANLTLDEIKEIYYTDFWIPMNIDQFCDAMKHQMFDTAVNHGMGNAIKIMQRAVATTADGIIGPNTRAAINAVSEPDRVLLFNAERIKFYCNLDTFGTFGRGWMRRVAHNLEYAAKDNGI